MASIDLYSIISEVNLRAKTHPIGMLQEIRKVLKGLKRLPTRNLFTSLTTFDEWAFHHGGRKELQFNIGIEHRNGVDEIRHGVAFSFETSQALPEIDPLAEKVPFFNDFLKLDSEKYADMRMWHYAGVGQSSNDYMPTSISPELVTENVFIFLGKRQPFDRLDYELLLNDLDRLLPLYEYTESRGKLPSVSTGIVTPFNFRPGATTKKVSTTATRIQREIDIDLQHNVIQEELHRQLAQDYGTKNVGDEHLRPCPSPSPSAQRPVVCTCYLLRYYFCP